MKSNLTFSRWLLSLLLVAFVWSGTAQAQSKPVKPEQDELSAIESSAVVVDQGQLNPNREFRSPVCPSGNLSEGFEDVIFPPSGWVKYNPLGANQWTRSTVASHSGLASALINYQYTGGEDWLVTPRLSVTTGDEISFWIRHYFLSAYPPDNLTVLVSTTDNSMTSFTNMLASLDAGTGYTGVFQQKTYNLDAYAGQNIYIAFKHTNDDGNGIYIDDVTGPELYSAYFASDATLDFGVTFDLGSYSMDYEIANCSAGDLELDFNNASPEVSISGLPLTVATGDIGTITVNFDPAVAGLYNGNFQLTTNDPENPILEAAVTSDVEEAVVAASIYENFDAYLGYSVPDNWIGNFSTRTTGGLGSSARFTRNLYGTGTYSTGQFATNFVEMEDDGVLSFYYRAVNYSSYPSNPTPATSFDFTMYISTDFGVTFTPIWEYDETTHVETSDYVFVEVDLSAYSGETAMFLMDAERFADDFYLDFDEFSVSFVEPGLEFLVDEVLMGDRPIGAWMKHAKLGIMNNPGKGSFTFTAADLDNNFGGFLSAASPELPFVLDEGESTDAFGIRTNSLELAPGAFTGSLALFYEPTSTRAAAVIPYSGNAYLPVDGDVWEMAFDASTISFPDNVAKGDFRNNYELPGENQDGWDVVYMLDVNAGDIIVNATLAGTDSKIAIYPADFGGVGGPDMDNAIESGTTAITGLDLYEGIYYLVVSASGADFTLDYAPTVMPAPVAVTNLTPADGAVDIINGDELTWSWGANTQDYRVVLGTSYPPATVVQDWATANIATDGSYTLSGLNPNLQYFWRIDVRNNNGSTDGEGWGFTTTITPPTDLEAIVNDPGESSTTVSVTLEWTGPTNRAFVGYNVYRNGVKITPTPVDNASFTDLGLARNTAYSYFVTSVYDEGESATSNTVSVTTQGVGTFDGYVYDGLTNDPIEDASVKITGDAGDYTVITTADGAYSTMAYKGTYNFTISATNYNSQVLSNVSLNHGATVSRNFYLSETPFPVAEVIAFELDDNSTQVSWSGIAPTPIELVKITQNPGTPENGYYQSFGEGYGVVYDLLAYPDASINSMNFHHASWDLFGIWEYKIHVYNWDTKTLLGTYGPYTTTGDDKWESGISLGNVSAGGASLVAILMEPLGNIPTDAYPDISSDDDEDNPQGSIYGSLDNLEGMTSSGIGNFLMELYIYTAQGTRLSAPRLVDFGEVVNAPNRMNTTIEASKSVIEQTSISITKGEESFTNRTVLGPSYADATRGIVSYDVWREKVYQPGTLENIGNTFSEDFVDFDWGSMDWGVYRWGVTVNYDAGQVSALTYSNTLDKDMEIEVDVAVSLNSNEAPGGTSVSFINMSEPDLELIYNTVLGNSGTFAWDEFRRGVYNIQVRLPGYAVVMETGVEIFDDASFTWLLEELLSSPSNLYVTPTAFATWNLGGGDAGGSFVPFMESFDGLANGELPVGWTRTPETNWAVYNSNNAGGTAPEMRFYFSPSNVGEYYLMTPSMSTEGQSQLTLSFNNYLRHYSSSYYYSARVVAIADGVEYIIQEWDPVTAHVPVDLLSYDLTAAHGVGATDFKIAWVFDGNPTGIWYWYLDDIMLNGSRSNAERSFEYSKVFLDGQLISETTDDEYQFDVSTLTPYETYTAGVAAVYSTGQSTTEEFDFIYVPCGDYDAPTAFAAAQIEGTLDIMLEWTNVDATALDTIAGVVVYRNGEEYAEIDFEDGVVASFTDEDLEFGTYNYCITYIYDSGAETCQGVVCSEDVVVTGGGYVNGTVTAFDGGAPIGGAMVTVFNDDFSFEFTTNATGYYEGEVVDGTYDYLVSADNFESQLLEDVTITFGETVTNDFELLEFPFPVNNVIAEYEGENAVKVTWNTPGTSGGGTIFEEFDNGMPSMLVVDEPTANWTVADGFLKLNASGTDAWRSAYYNEVYGDVLFEVELQRTVGATSGAMGIYVRGTNIVDPTVGNGENANVFTITQNGSYWYATMLNGDLMGDWTGWLTSSAINTTGSNVITAVAQGTTVQFFVNGTLVYTVNNTTLIEGKVGMFIAEGAAASTTVWDYMLIEPGAVVPRNYETNHVAVESKGSLTESYISYDNNVEPQRLSYHKNTASSRELEGYNVYRTTCYEDELTFLGYTLDTIFVDNQFGSLEAGVYKWAVEAVYTNNNAEPQFSNCLDKDMVTTVSVTVTTNSGDGPEETDVMFTNTSEPDLGLVYETELDETGYFMWEEFRKGIYDIYVEKNGFAPIEITDYLIDGPEDFVWLLEELLLPVEDLYVTPTGFATWRAGGEIPFEAYAFDFETDEMGWEIQGNVNGWQWGNTSSLSSTYMSFQGNSTNFIAVNADAAGSGGTPIVALTKSPMLELSNADEVYVRFDYRLLNDQMSIHYSIAGGDPILLEQLTANTSWTTNYMVALPEEALDSEVQILFLFEEASTWGYGGGVDNIVITDEPMDRELEYYKVWLDGNHIDDTPNTYYQYDVATLVEGQEYLSEVAAMYSNGMSEKRSYLWTYYSCENYPGPENLAGSASGQDVTLTWGAAPPPPPPGEGFEDDFEGYANFLIDFAPWTNVDVDGSTTYGMTGITWPNAYDPQSFIVFNPSATTPPLADANAHSGDKYVACFASVTPPNNDWLMSPLVPVGTGTTVNFWAKSYVADYGLERFKVGVSTTGTAPADFTIITPGAYVEAPATAWTEFSYDLSAYAGQEVYVGIQCVSNDAFFLMIDDFTVGAATSSYAFNPPSSEIGRGIKTIGESVAAIDRQDNSEKDANADIRTVEMSREMWDLEFSFDIDTPSGLTGLAGAETDGEFIYATKWSSSSDIVKFTIDGTYVETFQIPGVSSVRDMAFDGTYMYGAAASTTVYQMDFTNKTLIGTITAPTAVRAIAYDDDNDAFWGNNFATDLVLFDRSGATLNTIATPPSLYGAAYDNFSEGGPYLWFFTGTTTGGGCQVEQYDIAGGALTGVSHSVSAALGDYIAGGLYISEDLVEDKIIIGGTAQGTPDLAFAFELIDNSSSGGDFETGELLGANVYRDGLLIAEMVTDTFYVDQDVEYGIYTYCVTYVYESGAESCSEACVDVELPFPCDPPKELVGEYNWTEEAWGSMIEWNGPQDPIAEWLFYDDGANVDGIGGIATFSWAIKFDPAQLADYAGASLTKIDIYNRVAGSNELRIYEGTNAATLLHTQTLSGLGIETWEEVELTDAVMIDVTKELWIAVYTTDGLNYPAGCGNYTGNPNGDLITQDGVLWEHLNDLGLPYTWNLRGYVTTMAGATAALPMDKPVDQISNNGGSLAASGKPSYQIAGPASRIATAVRELTAFNVYREVATTEAYELIATVPYESGVTAYSYFDTDVEAQVGYNYQVTAFYTYNNGTCESDPAMALVNPEDDYVYVFVTSTSEFNLNSTRVYPNPADNNVVIESAKMNRVTVMNAVGQVVLDRAIEGRTRHDLNTSTYEAGIYLIRIETNEGIVTKRLTIVR